jgi:dihydroorotase/N-acyl-D-amino-acid deacylase
MFHYRIVGILVLTCALLPAARAAEDAYDIIITNGHIIDGTGSPWYSGDVGIRDGRIAAIGNLSNAGTKRTIDAQGMVVAPGFIDMLGQSEITILVDPRLPSKIYQGITTEITGEGESVAPLNDAMIKENQLGLDHYGIKADWRTLSEYFARLRAHGVGINLGTYIGATSVREMVIGYGDRAPTAGEVKRMQALVEEGMRQGAGPVDRVAISAGALCAHRRTDCDGAVSVALRRNLRHAYAQRRRRGGGRPR